MSDTPATVPFDDVICSRFRSSRQEGKTPDIKDFLLAEDDPRYLFTLEELVRIDMQQGWLDGFATAAPTGEGVSVAAAPLPPGSRLEGYLERFPRLREKEPLLRLAAFECALRRRFGEESASEEYCRRFPEAITSGEELEKFIETVVIHEPGEKTAAPAGLPLDRYVLLQEHARGGFGVVWRARDPMLQRDIALKQLSERVAEMAGNRQRFVNEARITARLEHPGVVPVYDLGKLEETSPYYTMKLVAGQTLEEVIRNFHTKALTESERAVEQVRMINIYLNIVRTMEYAASRGVVHRDLKPSNIIVGAYGETIILDWGLAKELGSARTEEPRLDGGESFRTDETRPGAVQGTPAYMSPEQAAGRTSEIDERSDVYALGVVLYQLMTGKLPFTGKSVAEMLRQVREATPPRPRILDGRVPAPLEAVILKAMSKKRQDRYASIGELRREIERLVADEPVSAYREPMSLRVRRWMRRHRTLVTGLAAALLAALVSLSIGVVLLSAANERERHLRQAADLARIDANKQRQRAEDNLVEAETQRDRATRNFKMAQAAVDTYLTEISADPQLRKEGLEPLRQRLLTSARTYYVDFVKQDATDPELREELANANLRLATIDEQLGNRQQARAAIETARDLFAKLVARHPDNVPFQLQLAECYNRLAIAHRDAGAHAEGNKLFLQAIDRQKKIEKEHPETKKLGKLADFQINLAVLHVLTGKFDEAKNRYREALTAVNALVDAEAQLERQGALQMNIGELERRQGHAREAEAANLECVRLTKKLTEMVPDNPRYAQRLGRAHNNLGLIYRFTNRLDQASAEYQRAIEISKALARRHPYVPEYRFDLAGADMNLGTVYRFQGKLEKAAQTYRLARDEFDFLTRAYPDNPKYRFQVAGVGLNLGATLAELGKFAEAEAALTKGLTAVQELIDKHPDDLRYRTDLGQFHMVLGSVAHQNKKTDQALEQYGAAITALSAVLAKQPMEQLARSNLITSLRNRTMLLEDLGRFEDACQDLEQAAKLAAPPDKPMLRMEWGRMQTLAGHHASGTNELIALLKLTMNHPLMRYNAACVFALAAKAAQSDKDLAAAERKRKASEYADQAMEHLDGLRKAGYFKKPQALADLKQDHDFDTLRKREDFGKLLKALEQ